MHGCLNQSTGDHFQILAFSTPKLTQIFLFTGILLMYLATILGNLTIITLVCAVPKLHTPMYFFLSNLAAVDIASTSACVPKLLLITITQDHAISFQNCMVQMFFVMLCSCGEIFVLASMAYDRYVAICKPLQYYIIMSKALCISLVIWSWVTASLNSLLHTLLTAELLFCSSQDVNNFFCDLNVLISMSSSDTTSRKLLIVFEGTIITVLPFVLTIISYVFIISTILKIKSSDGRFKIFSSCTSHLITVILFYGPCYFLYMKSEFLETNEQDKVLAMLYVVVVPMVNPLVYSLRNKDIWDAIITLGKKWRIFKQ
ncbi:olfactory receptor 5V1-like [Hyperolius riggenbachi]|uniref:olfactory receptor 5V1-like n=1 Tax=Hyperolius riggenbachi TaxID=752182 RepID=UPI0035A31A58